MGAVATRSRSANFFAFAILGSRLPAVDEVLQLFLVLVGVPVGLIAEHASLLDEVLKRRSRVPGGAEAQLPGGFCSRQRPAPTKQIHELWGKRRQPAPPQRKRGELETDGGQHRGMELARGVKKCRQRLSTLS